LQCTCTFAGDWLLLKNLHLVVSWLPVLEKEIHNLGVDNGSGNSSFRLFLTSEAHGKFPPTLLEASLKVELLRRV
jgi:dynein heavy chain 2